MPDSDAANVRLDKWLWAARFYKTRGEATEAVAGGKVTLNGKSAKPARLVAAGDQIEVSKAPYRFHLTVTGVAERRGSAEVAASLYQESEQSRLERQRLAEQHRLAPQFDATAGKPSRRDRAAWERFRGRGK